MLELRLEKYLFQVAAGVNFREKRLEATWLGYWFFFNGEWNVVEPQNSGASGKQLSELSAANGLNPCLFSISPKNIQNVFCHGESHV